MSNKVRNIALQATKSCQEKCSNAAWMWEDKFGQLMINESVRYLKSINSDFEAEQLEDFWDDTEHDV